MKLEMSVCIEAPLADVWTVLADVENISQWSNAVISAHTEDQKTGVGTRRTCVLANKSIIVEEWVDWIENETYTYQGFHLPLIKTAQNKWSVHAVSTTKTRVTSQAKAVVKGGVLGVCLEPLLKLVSKRLGTASLAALKYLVEQGTPYKGRHSELPVAMATC